MTRHFNNHGVVGRYSPSLLSSSPSAGHPSFNWRNVMFESLAYIQAAVVMYVMLEMFKRATEDTGMKVFVSIRKWMATTFFIITLFMAYNIVAEHRFEIENWRTYSDANAQSAEQTYEDLGLGKVPGKTIKK
jgi:hypothetical protein